MFVSHDECERRRRLIQRQKLTQTGLQWMERLEKHLWLLLASSLLREFTFCRIPDVALASDVTLASDVALASDAALASALVIKLSWISFHLHVC